MATNMSMKVIPGLYIVETIFTFLATLAVCLRLWARRLTKRQLAISDYAAIGALVSHGDILCAVQRLSADNARRLGTTALQSPHTLVSKLSNLPLECSKLRSLV